jgi:hypothetical protein
VVSAATIKPTAAIMTSMVAVNATVREVEMSFGLAIRAKIERNITARYSFGPQLPQARY